MPSLPPPPPPHDLPFNHPQNPANPHFKSTTIQFRNHHEATTKKYPERCGCHQKHFKDCPTLHTRRKNDAAGRGVPESVVSSVLKARDKKRGPLTENIMNLIPEKEPVNEHGQHIHQHSALDPNHNDPYDVDPALPKPSMHMYKSAIDGGAIPVNARKPVYTCSGQLGVRGTTGVPDPVNFVKQGSGTKVGPVPTDRVVATKEITKPGRKAEKWTRPLQEGFKPKMGKPTRAALAAEQPKEPVVVAKKDFLKDNKTGSVKVVQKNMSKAPAPPVLGKMPSYLKEKRAGERVEFERAETERSERRSVRREQRKLDKQERRDLLTALRKRRNEVLGRLVKFEMKGDRGGKKQLLDVEIEYLDKDIKRLEAAGVLVIK